jgi:hypothetical protein
MSVIAEMIARNGHQGCSLPPSYLTTESEKSVCGGQPGEGGNLGPGL